MKRNRLTSHQTEKLVAVHSSLSLQDRVKSEYRESPASMWDVNPEDANQVDENEQLLSFVGVSLHVHDPKLHFDGSEHDDTGIDSSASDDALG